MLFRSPAKRNALNGTALAELEALFTALQRDFATRVVVLANGEVVEQGEPERVLTSPQHPATRELLQLERARRGVQ